MTEYDNIRWIINTLQNEVSKVRLAKGDFAGAEEILIEEAEDHLDEAINKLRLAVQGK